METFAEIYLFIASIWFFQEWKENGKPVDAMIIGAFWIYEVFHILTNKLKP